MPELQNGTKEKQRWLSLKEREGFLIKKVNQYVYDIDSKKVNIRFSNPRSDNAFWFWFGITFGRLEGMDVFVWLCGTAENYYVIPCEEMRRLIDANKGKWVYGKQNRPEFILDSYYHKYLPAKIDISSYHRNQSPLH
jgi:hypothetical protein